MFAEAWQLAQGRTGAQVKTGAAALTELTDAMKKGLVKTDKLFPFLEDLLRRNAEPGLATARLSAMAEKNRFQNLWREGEENFAMGGAQEGMALFWRQMQLLGQWFKENGSVIGEQFRGFILWLDLFRVGIKEFFEFFATGESNDLYVYFKQWGLDLKLFRDSFLKLKDTVLEGLGLTGVDGDEVPKRIQAFSDSLLRILDSVDVMLKGIFKFIKAFQEWSDSEGLPRLSAPLTATLPAPIVDQSAFGSQLFDYIPGVKFLRILAATNGTNTLRSGATDVGQGVGGALKGMTQGLGAATGFGLKAPTDFSLNSVDGGYNAREEAIRNIREDVKRDYTLPFGSMSSRDATQNTQPVVIQVSADAEKLGIVVKEITAGQKQAEYAGALVNNAPKIK